MPSVTSLDNQFPTRAGAPPAPFPKSTNSFEGVLIAAVDPGSKRKGVAGPMPSRTSALRMPSRALKLTTGIPAGSTSNRTTFRPLPLSGRGQAVHTLPTQPATPPAAPPTSTPSSSPSAEILAEQVISDYKEYQEMMSENTSSAARLAPTEPQTTDLRPTVGQAPSPEVALPFAQSLSTGSVAPMPNPIPLREQATTYEIEAAPRTPFPRRGEVPVPYPRNTVPAPTRENQARTSAVASYKDDHLPANAAGDLSFGTTSYARSPSGEITARRRPGLLGTLGNFAKDVASGVTLGFYHPPDEPAPSGFSRVFYPFKKIVIDGMVKDLVIGVPGSFLRGGEHTTPAALNTAETIPDPTIRHFAKGRNITSKFEPERVASAAEFNPQPQPHFEQPVPTPTLRPRLWETY